MFATAAAMESFHHTVKESANLMAVMEMQLRGSLAKNEAFEKEKVRPDQSPGQAVQSLPARGVPQR